jgi:hypothetical protein
MDLFPGDQKMKWADRAWTSWMIALLTVSTQTPADTSMQTAMANCREEAVAIGLVEDVDITTTSTCACRPGRTRQITRKWGPGEKDRDEMQAETPGISLSLRNIKGGDPFLPSLYLVKLADGTG